MYSLNGYSLKKLFNRGNFMYGLCPACGSELDDEGNCWVCGYMAHFGSPDDYDYDDFNDEYLP